MKSHNRILVVSMAAGIAGLIGFHLFMRQPEGLDAGDKMLYEIGAFLYMILVSIFAFLYEKERLVDEMWNDIEYRMNQSKDNLGESDDERKLDETGK